MIIKTAPTSLNVPFSSLIDDSGCMLPNNQLKQVLDDAKVRSDIKNPIVVMCGSGVTACVVILALEQLGRIDNVRLYDGSWADYASRNTSPIKTYRT